MGATDDIFEALDIQDDLQMLYTSGTVFHAYLGEKLPGLESRRRPGAQDRRKLQAPLLHHLPHLFRVPGTRLHRGRALKPAPTCGEEAEVYSRITGYYRPVKNWNDGKAQEFLDRKVYEVGKAGLQPVTRKRRKATGCCFSPPPPAPAARW